MTEFNTLVLAALLHDIGKLLQRGRSLPFDIKGKHPEVSAQFITAFQATFAPHTDVELLRKLVLHHHRGPGFDGLRADDLEGPTERALAFLVNKADGLSASERGEQAREWQDYKATPLASIFCQMAGGPSRSDSATVLRHHPCGLKPPKEMTDKVFPSAFSEYASGEMDEFLKEFGAASDPVLRQARFPGFETLFAYFLDILQSYAGSIPSDTQVAVPDVSLYDHLKSTAAIAACLYRFLDSNGGVSQKALEATARQSPFLLAVGDLSGIQSYIFDITEGGTSGGGVARRLRARSLFIQLISEVVAHHILRTLSLPPSNALMSSGGKFYLLLPNLQETEAALEQVRGKVDRWCLESLRAEVSLNLAHVPFGEADLRLQAEGKDSTGEMGGFGGVVGRAIQALARQKERRLQSVLVGTGTWDEARFVFPPFQGDSVCRSCGKLPRPSGEDLCARCLLDKEWGARLPRSRYISVVPGGQGDMDILGYGVSLHERAEEVPSSSTLVLAVNRPGGPPANGTPTLGKYMVSQVPTKVGEGELLTFEEIAKSASGRPYLGFLKADADRLGETFASGLEGRDTVSRLATLSRQIDLFFSGWVQHILTEDDFRTCYPVFCGGDDLFVVGPWDVIIRLAERAYHDYRKFTCSALTLSAGVVIAQDRYPVSRAAHDVERAREAAKRNREEGRDRIGILGRTLKWDDWAKVSKEWRGLSKVVADEQAPAAFLYRLLEYGRMWQAYRRKDNPDPLGLRAQPLLAYTAARTLDPKRQPRLAEWVQGLTAVKPLDKQQEFLLDNLTLLAQLLILGKGARE